MPGISGGSSSITCIIHRILSSAPMRVLPMLNCLFPSTIMRMFVGSATFMCDTRYMRPW